MPFLFLYINCNKHAERSDHLDTITLFIAETRPDLKNGYRKNT